MGNCWKQKAKDYLWAQVGEPCGKSSKYAEEMDAIHYYNYPKNGVANSCALFCDNSLLHACTDPSYDEDPECAKYTALNAMYEPQSEGANAGAGCVQKVDYFRRADAYYTNTQDFCELDEIFFASPDYVSSSNPEGLYHTGMIVAWGYIEELGKDGFTYIDGNSWYQGESGMVGYHYVAYDDPKIHGAGRPNWDGWEPYDKNVDVKPEPTPEPVIDRYEVCVNSDSWLNVRSGAGTEFPVIWKLYDEDVVPILEIENGWGRIDDYGWVSMEYLKKV